MLSSPHTAQTHLYAFVHFAVADVHITTVSAVYTSAHCKGRVDSYGFQLYITMAIWLMAESGSV